MNRVIRVAFFALAVLFLLSVAVQVGLAGLSLFWRSNTWETHTGLGHLVPLIPLLMVLLALAGRLTSHLPSYSGLLLVGVLVQTELFVLIRELSGFAAAFHPVLALVLFWGGVVVAQRSWALGRSSEIAPARAKLVEPAPARGPARPGATCDPVTGLGC
jgi:hypothetical protein